MIIKMMNYEDELQILSDLVQAGKLHTGKQPLPFSPQGMFDQESFLKFTNTCLVIDDVLTAEIRQADDSFQLYFVLKSNGLDQAMENGQERYIAADHILELTGTVYMMNDKGTTIHSHYYLPPIPDNIKSVNMAEARRIF